MLHVRYKLEYCSTADNKLGNWSNELCIIYISTRKEVSFKTVFVTFNCLFSELWLGQEEVLKKINGRRNIRNGNVEYYGGIAEHFHRSGNLPFKSSSTA